MSDGDRVEITSRPMLRQWLTKHHEQKESIWLVTYKKPDARHVPYTEFVEEALCFGWIDSQPRLLDGKRSMRRLSPRNPKSAWSKINKQLAERLIKSGLMQAAGLAAIAAAKKNGSWEKLNDVEELLVPADLAAGLRANRVAKGYFELFPPSTRKAILDWINQAKRSETRAARIAETVSKAEKNIRANQWRQPSGK